MGDLILIGTRYLAEDMGQRSLHTIISNSVGKQSLSEKSYHLPFGSDMLGHGSLSINISG